MKNVDIIYGKYVDETTKNKTIGGVQTYITDIVKILVEMGVTVRIVQFAQVHFKHESEKNVFVEGFAIKGNKPTQRYQKLYDLAQETAQNVSLTIFATDSIVPKKIKGKNIAIQHGINWDIPCDKGHSIFRQVVSKAFSAYKTVKRMQSLDAIVCVDYNFINWYRTQLDCVKSKLYSFPNYTRIAKQCEKPTDKIRIVFARRLFEYRGTRVFTSVAKKILSEYKNVEISIAGTGPDEQWMKKQLSEFKNVVFTSYESEKSLDFHIDKHIAVVPTVGSEGTSLSLLEAMSAQCAVVCSDVGGMTNIVLNGYNGIMVPAGNDEELYLAIKKLIDNPNLLGKISKNGYSTVFDSFSYDIWRKKWEDLFLRF